MSTLVRTESVLDRLIAHAASIHRPVAACPEESTLARYRAAQLPDEEQEPLELHLASCDRCRALHTRAVLEAAPVPSPEQVWGASIALAIVGPLDMPLTPLQSKLPQLDAAGIRHARLDGQDEVFWAAVDTSTNTLSGDPVQPEHLAAFVRQMLEVIDPEGPLGANITVGRGFIGLHGPAGRPYEEALAGEASITAGQLKLSAEAAELVRSQGVHLLPERDSDFQLVVRVVSGLQTTDRLRSPFGGAQRTTFTGIREHFDGTGGRLVASAGERQRPPSSPASNLPLELSPVDRLHLQFQAPPTCWLYLLLEQNGRLRAFSGDEPLRRPGAQLEDSIRLPLETLGAPVHSHLLATLEPVVGLEALVDRANEAAVSGPGSALQRFGELLLERQTLESFAIVPAGTFIVRR